MGFFVWLFLFVAIGLAILYSLGHERRRDFERRMSIGVERAHRMFDDTSRRFSEIRLKNIPQTLKRRFSQDKAAMWDDRPSSSGFQAHRPKSSETDKREHNSSESETEQRLSTENDGSHGISKSDVKILSIDNDGKTEDNETSPEANGKSETELCMATASFGSPDVSGSISPTDNTDNAQHFETDLETQTHVSAISTFLTPISEDDDTQLAQPESDPSTHNNSSVPEAVHVVIDNVEVCHETEAKKIVPTGSVIPMIKLDTCPADKSTDQTSRAVSFVSNDEVIAPVSTYNTVSPRRMSLKPGNVPFVQKRGSILLPAKTVSQATRRQSLLVPPQGYVCPRRTSVLFSSDIFAHSPRRKSSMGGRNLHIPELTEPTQSKRFFLPRKSVIKNVIRSSWSAVKGTSSGASNLRTGIRATTSCTGSYYPHRRRSSVGFSTEDTSSKSAAEGEGDKLPSLRDIDGSLARRKSALKKMNSASFQSETLGESTKTERPQRRRDSRACLSYFRRQSMFGRRQSTHIPKQKGNYLTG